MNDDKLDQDINSLVNQLKQTTKVNKEVTKKADEEGVDPEDVERFVVRNSERLVNQSLDVLDNVKDYIMASGDPDSISSLSELIRASSSALDSLNKIVVQNKRSTTTIVAKQMDINSKKNIEDSKQPEGAYITTREEMFKKILDEAKVITVSDEEASLDQK